jgi:two-component system sensor histidine kinase BaeS
MTTRITALAGTVATVAVVVAALLSYGLVRRAAGDEGRLSLARQADLVAAAGVGAGPGEFPAPDAAATPAPPGGPDIGEGRSLGRLGPGAGDLSSWGVPGRFLDSVPAPGLGTRAPRGAGGVAVQPRLRRALQAQEIDVLRVGSQGRVWTEDSTLVPVVAPDVPQLLSGTSVSTMRVVAEDTWLVEGRPAPGGPVMLVQRREDSRAFAQQVLARTGVALGVGLAVALIAGVPLARRFSRSLRRTAAAARRLAAGSRQVRAPVDGPAEIGEVASALNALAAALETSEGRQKEFLLSVSHELRTPLTAITGFAESLADGLVTGEKVPSAGATIRAEAGRLTRLVTDLLDLARLGAQDFRIDPTPVDLTALVADAAQVWQVRCDAEGVPFTTQIPRMPVPVHTDPLRVRQILDGLAENALRVTPAGRPIVFALHTEATHALLDVRDGGPGLTPEDCAVAFDRSALYQRYRGIRKVGTGVGLALVAGLTTRLGGHATAGRAPEGGARFTIRLPVGPANAHLDAAHLAERTTAKIRPPYTGPAPSA